MESKDYMYDIFFDLLDMHQVVVEEETFVEIDLDDEPITFNFDLDLPFPNETNDDYPVIVRKSYGHTCKQCGEICPHAESNQKDGSFKCYSCRKYG